MDLEGARAFEQSYKARPLVAEDPFYSVPPDTATAAAGTLLKVEEFSDTSLYTLAPNLSLSRFMFQSMTSTGQLVPVSGYILWPYSARDFSGGMPVVVWAHGTSGSSPECAPSNIQNLWHHFQTPYQLALYGYVVVAPDYAGLGVGMDALGNAITHEYLTGCAQANDLFYSVPAAREAFPELSKEFVVIGSSQGGGAVWAFAEKLSCEPMSGHLGTIALSPATRVLDLPEDGWIFPFVLLNLAPALQKFYKLSDPTEIFTEEGMQSLKKLYDLQGTSTINFQVMSPSILKPNWRDHPSIRAWQEVGGNGGKEISGPMLVIQGGTDSLVITSTVEEAIRQTMAAHSQSQIEYHLLPNVSHAPAMYAGLPIYMDWIGARFAGLAVKSGYTHTVEKPARPAESQQAEANWFVQKQTHNYQIA